MHPGKRVSPYCYISQVCFLYVLLFFSLSTLLGCAIPLKDSLPEGSPKGYVEFYYLFSETKPTLFKIRIYSLDNNYRRVLEGVTEGCTSYDKIGLRIAKLPGTYKFAICLGDVEKVVAVAVEEGKITPVKIAFRNLHTSSLNYPIIKVSFNLDVTVEENRPTYDLKSIPPPTTGSGTRPGSGSVRGAEPRPGPGSGSVRGVLKNKEDGTPVKNGTIALIKVKSVEGGKVTFELGFSADGKLVGGLSTKTDGAGAFRFEEVPKGTPYVLGAVDQSGKNVVVILSANDNVKDLGIVYQKKQSDKPKP